MSCNTISAGTGRACKKAGGIKAIYIASVPDILTITPDRTTGGLITDIDDDATALVFYKFEIEQGTGYFKENTVGEMSLGFEKTNGGILLDYSEAMNVILEPILRGHNIALAEDNNGKMFIQGDLNPLRSVPSEMGIVEGLDGLHGYNISLIAKDGMPMREIDTSKIAYGTGSITITTV